MIAFLNKVFGRFKHLSDRMWLAIAILLAVLPFVSMAIELGKFGLVSMIVFLTLVLVWVGVMAFAWWGKKPSSDTKSAPPANKR